MDKGAANRFIKHAIAQVRLQRPPGDDSGPSHVRFSDEGDVQVPVKMTSKMVARAQYEKDLKELGSEEESDLEMIEESGAVETIEEKEVTNENVSTKGKGKAISMSSTTTDSGKKRRRPVIDPFAGALIF